MTKLGFSFIPPVLAVLLWLTPSLASAMSEVERETTLLAHAGTGRLTASQLDEARKLFELDHLLEVSRLERDTINAIGALLLRATDDDAFQQRQLDELGDLRARIGIDVDPAGFAYLADSIAVSHGRPQQFGALPDISGGLLSRPPGQADTARDNIGLPPSADFYRTIEMQLKKGANPESLLVRPLALQHPVYPRRPALRKELMRLVRADQAVRNGRTSEGKVHQVDAVNHAELVKIVDRYGFSNAADVGRFGVYATWLVIQHQIDDPALMKRYLREAEVLMTHGDLPRVSYALLFDRVSCLIDGGPQRYGTQSGVDANGWFVYPLRNESHVNLLRAEMLMGPLQSPRVAGDCGKTASAYRK